MYDYLKKEFEAVFGRRAEYIFSAPGRTELGGNHTDHQLGRVLAAAVNLDTRAAVALNAQRCIHVNSDGYAPVTVALDELEPVPAERETTAALVRGVAAAVTAQGYEVPGFDAYVVSTVLPGSGLSSSAAFEVLMGTVMNHLAGARLSAVKIAQLSKYAENVYFSKPSGLMDQTASSVGNIVSIDFANADEPKVTPIAFDFSSSGHALCIIDSGADHADLTDDYAAIPRELGAVCCVFGKEHLREVDEAEFFSRLAEVRAAAGDRAALRAIHIFSDNRRVDAQVNALISGDFAEFLRLVSESGRSSWMYLQNVIPAGGVFHQELALALALTEKLLDGRGAFRVHGGGFAGTLQAFVPLDMLPEFCAGIERVLGAGKCHVLNIRHEGGCLLEKI